MPAPSTFNLQPSTLASVMHCSKCDFPNDVTGHEEWACAHCGTEHEPSTFNLQPSTLASLSERVDQLEARLAELVQRRPPPELSPEAHHTVVNLVAHHMRIPPVRIRSHVKQTPLVHARWIAWALLRSRFGWTFQQIGRVFHVTRGTVMHGIAKLPAERDQSRRLALVCKLIEADLDEILNPKELAV